MSAGTPAPQGRWDCHAHLFGPYDRYPLMAERSYTPPPAVLSRYLSVLDRLGFEHGVLVHPSAYGEDFSLLFDALAKAPRLRGVLVLQAGTLPTLRGLRDKGIRGVRFSHRSGAGTNFAGSASFDDLLALAPAMAEAGLHAEMWTDCRVLPDIEAALRAMPVPVVVDHMGGFDPLAGIDQPGFRSLLSLLETGRVAIKTCAYRNLLTVPSYEAGRPFHRALVEANPDGLVWGTDWPHLRIDPEPDPANLLAMLARWTDDEAVLERILVDNPAHLYA